VEATGSAHVAGLQQLLLLLVWILWNVGHVIASSVIYLDHFNCLVYVVSDGRMIVLTVH
jgi:hypothetical protein